MTPSARRTAVFVGVGLALAVALAVLLGRSSGGTRGSSVSRGAEGLWVARRYLEERGTTANLLERPLSEAPAGGTLVVAFPWQVFSADSLERDLAARYAWGGDLLLVYSGRGQVSLETLALGLLGLGTVTVRGSPPLGLRAYRRWARETWAAHAEGPLAGRLADLRLPALDWVPRAPPAATVLYREPGGHPLVFSYREGRSRVTVVPLAALANAGLDQAGSVDLLETLRASLAAPWVFDEYHHGLVAAGDFPPGGGRMFDLLGLHLFVLYVLGVLALARRFGPPWREAPAVTGTTATFFLGLGALHHRLGHHAEGARRLLARVAELEGAVDAPPELVRAAEVGGPEDFVALARAVARNRQGRRP